MANSESNPVPRVIATVCTAIGTISVNQDIFESTERVFRLEFTDGPQPTAFFANGEFYLSADEYEDAVLSRLAEESLAESDERIPYEQVRRQLGLS